MPAKYVVTVTRIMAAQKITMSPPKPEGSKDLTKKDKNPKTTIVTNGGNASIFASADIIGFVRISPPYVVT